MNEPIAVSFEASDLWLPQAPKPQHRTAGDMLADMERARQAIEAAGPIVPRMVSVMVRDRVEMEAIGPDYLDQLQELNVGLVEHPYMPTNRVALTFADGTFAVLKIRKEGP